MSGTDKDNARGWGRKTCAAYDALIANGSYLRTRAGFWDRLGLTPVKTALRLLLRNMGTEKALFHKVSSVCKLLEFRDVKVTDSILVPSEKDPSYSYAWVIGESRAGEAQS